MDPWIFLSHILDHQTPGYGGEKAFQVTCAKALQLGHSCNQSHWTLSNHVGTHIDAPFHFSDQGKKIDEFSAHEWFFHRVCLLDLNVHPGEIIELGDWCEQVPQDADLLLLRTGFEQYRDREIYWQDNPGIGPDVGSWLRLNRPALRAVGLDFISLTSFRHRPVGKLAHQAFLDPSREGNPLLIIEDMALKKLQVSPQQVIVLPLRVAGSDGSPVTIVAQRGQMTPTCPQIPL